MASTKNPLHRLFGVDASFHGDRSQEKKDPNVNLEVISLGLSRTGTTSLQEALIKLGFGPCHGGVDLFRSPAQTATYHSIYTDIISGKSKAGDATEARPTPPSPSSSPRPSPPNPHAKVILTTRPDGAPGWWTSIWSTPSYHWRHDFLRLLFRTLIYPVSFLRRTDDKVQLIRQLYLQRYGCWDERTYEAHNAHVRKLVPRERLLEFDVREGWGPLCGFLGVGVPTGEGEEFPRVNERESMQGLYVSFMVFGACVWAFYGVAVLGAVGLAVRSEVVMDMFEGVMRWVCGLF